MNFNADCNATGCSTGKILELYLKVHPSDYIWVDLNTRIYMKTLINAPTKLNNLFLLEQQFETYKIICIDIPK